MYVQKRDGDTDMKMDKEEKYLLDALEAETIELATPSKEENEAIKSAANSTLKKISGSLSGSMNITLPGYKKAMEMGVPYQTLISGLILRYVEGDLKLNTDSSQ